MAANRRPTFSKKCVIILVLVLMVLYVLVTQSRSFFIAKKEFYNTTRTDDKQLISNITSNNITQITNEINEESHYLETLTRIKSITACNDKPLKSQLEQNGDYWMLKNFIPAEISFRCHESITYTTHGDFSFLDNIIPLAERWRGPISIALHAPGSDFKDTMNSIAYLRNCEDPIIRNLVSFHIYFNVSHFPDGSIYKLKDEMTDYNCSLPPPYKTVDPNDMYRAQKKMLYPINIGRNFARIAAQTYFILASDVELYPSLNMVQRFLKMIATNPQFATNIKTVFALPLFEVKSDQKVPNDKEQLLQMLDEKTAISFHANVCPSCHFIPKFGEWCKQPQSTNLNVFYTAKRTGKFSSWEPIYIGTNNEPFYDERLSWEGKRDKMTQGYIMCIMDYDFSILDSAFLVHKPGIKTYHRDSVRDRIAGRQYSFVDKVIVPELKSLLPQKKECSV